MKRNHVSSGSSNIVSKIPQEHQNNDDDDERKPTLVERGIGRKTLLIVILVILSLLALANTISIGHGSSTSSTDRYGPPSNATNKFVARFEEELLKNDLGRDFVPLIFDDGKILCRRNHLKQLSRYRMRFFTQMVRKGRRWFYPSSAMYVDGGLPMLVMEEDGNGCHVHLHKDQYPFPRFAWSMLAPKHGGCAAIGMPSYETWRIFHHSHKTQKHWERTFQKNEKQYPWQSKINKAIWRGSTTYEGSQYHASKLGETPRGILVNRSMEHPDLIDASFHKIIQKFQSQRKELAAQFTVSKRVNFRQMMKYKAIIDIDGNNWSSRFGMLLCSNSVVIKIDPDFVEYFYGDGGDVQPMIHYVPASLENITEVVAYVMNKTNEDEMKAMIQSANSWCKQNLSEEDLAKDAILQLETYKSAMDSYSNSSWKHEWKHVRQRFTDTVDDLVDCDTRSFIDHFISPIFVGF